MIETSPKVDAPCQVEKVLFFVSADKVCAFQEHVIPRLALTLVLLIAPAEWDRFSIDHWRRRAA